MSLHTAPGWSRSASQLGKGVSLKEKEVFVGQLICLLRGPEQAGSGPLGRITRSLFSKNIFLGDGLTRGIF